MLVDLIKNRIIQKKSLLLYYYKTIGLNENQVLIILLIMQLSSDDRKFVTARELSDFMTLTIEEIDSQISNLVKSKFIKIENKNGKSIINLSPLFTQLAIICENSLANKNSESNLVKIIQDQFEIPMNEDQKNSIKNFLERDISIQTLTELIITNDIKDYETLEKLIKSSIRSKPKELTKYNWLAD
ncbi:DnaD family protein [Spiroplasma endosymbiont of Panorpa germanica]|uniref:DnaD family protein n=1 Tax=Spiroplasma endosymbiont of Panorpa germanica TaxID=3066314 RepID=UPI0030CCFEE6